MDSGISFNAAELALIGALLGSISSGLIFMFHQLLGAWKDRSERAEIQVDMLIPAIERQSEAIERLTEMVRRHFDRAVP